MKLVDRGILIDSTLIINDLHLGLEESYRSKGILVPRVQYKKLYGSLNKLLLEVKPKRVIINGDVKHEFSRISDVEWREMRKIFELIQKRAELLLIKGNHDTFTPIVAKKLGIEVLDFEVIGETYICHGDVIPKTSEFKKAKTIVIGHEHPAISLREGAKFEKYKCFLKTKYKDKQVVVIPSFTPLVEGSDITAEKFLSPFLKGVKNVEVSIVEKGEIFEFGEIKLAE